LAGEHVESRPERQRDVGDGREIAHPKLADHRSRSRSDRSPQWSFARIREMNRSWLSRTRHTGCSPRRTVTRSPATRVVPVCPSNETSRSSAQPSIGSMTIVNEAGTTRGGPGGGGGGRGG